VSAIPRARVEAELTARAARRTLLRRVSTAATSVPVVLNVLYEAGGLPRIDLPKVLEEEYGGELRLERSGLVTNFVQTIDGVVTIPGIPNSNALVADGSDADRFVMSLLRAVADAVLVGSGTLRASPRGLWTAEQVYPARAEELAELRRGLGLPAKPERVVLTGSGSIAETHPVLADGALVLTTEEGAARLAGRLPEAASVIPLGGGARVDAREAVGYLRDRGHELILSEAGPHTLASLLEAGLVDELFLTVSPLVAGRSPASERWGFVQGHEALPDRPVRGRVLGVRRSGEHLFLRYGFRA
jgi:riboflavin biosynthesis pyrimidine reductase